MILVSVPLSPLLSRQISVWVLRTTGRAAVLDILASTDSCDAQLMCNCLTRLQAVGRCAAVRGVQALTVPAVSDAQLEEPIQKALQHAVASKLCETGSPVVVLVGSLQAAADPVPVMITRASL